MIWHKALRLIFSFLIKKLKLKHKNMLLSAHTTKFDFLFITLKIVAANSHILVIRIK